MLGYSVVRTSKTRSFKNVNKLESAINIWTSSSVLHLTHQDKGKFSETSSEMHKASNVKLISS